MGAWYNGSVGNSMVDGGMVDNGGVVNSMVSWGVVDSMVDGGVFVGVSDSVDSGSMSQLNS